MTEKATDDSDEAAVDAHDSDKAADDAHDLKNVLSLLSNSNRFSNKFQQDASLPLLLAYLAFLLSSSLLLPGWVAQHMSPCSWVSVTLADRLIILFIYKGT